MKVLHRFLAVLVAAAITLAALPVRSAMAYAADDFYSTTILFTSDMHSHLEPISTKDGGESGGFARVATLLKEQRKLHPDAVTVDGGDFSMGSLFQVLYSTDAAELRLMGEMGYDATTLGNHEFDYRQSGFTEMLESAVACGEDVPTIVAANYSVPDSSDPDYDEGDAAAQQAMDDYGIQDHILIERGGITYGIFGLIGEDADADAPESGMVLSDCAEIAQEQVDAIKAEADPDMPLFIICLSHSGTDDDPKKSEDEILASKVDGIDVILSGHTHTVLEEPIQVNDTIIASCGCYTAYVGVMTVTWQDDGTKSGVEYQLIPVDETVEDDPEIAGKIAEFKGDVVTDYLSLFGYNSFDEVVGTNQVVFDSEDDLYYNHRESGLGNLIADSYIYAVEQAQGEDAEPPALALTVSGVIRGSFTTGDITVADVFNVSSLGTGTDGLAGYPLAEIWITGKELKQGCEIDASIQGMMPAAQLHVSGITFTWNPHRMFLNRVESVQLVNPDGSTEELEDNRLYKVVTGLYCAQMLSAVKSQSYGLLSITPKYADGTEITDFDDCIIYDQDGNELKEWYALASYIESFGDEGIPDIYAQEVSTTRKVEDDSLNPVALLRNMNWITAAVIIAVIVIIVVIVLIIRRIIRKSQSGNFKKA